MPYYNDYLAHYGVKGMRWGVRRYENKDGTLTAFGKKREKNRNEKRSDEPKEKKKWSTGKKVAVVGAAIIAAYATYKFVDSGQATRLMAKGKSLLNGTSAINFKVDASLADKTLSSDDIAKKVVSRINSDYGAIGTKNNCRRCTYAYELSRRGYNVKATKSLSATGQNRVAMYNLENASNRTAGTGMIGVLSKTVQEVTSGTSSNANSFSSYVSAAQRRTIKTGTSFDKTRKLFNILSEQPNGSRGEVDLGWTVGGRHSIAYEIINNKPTLFDCQSGKTFKNTDEVVSYYGDLISDIIYTRLDDKPLDFDQLLKWVENA